MINFRKLALLITSLLLSIVFVNSFIFEGPLRVSRGIKGFIPQAHASVKTLKTSSGEEYTVGSQFNELEDEIINDSGDFLPLSGKDDKSEYKDGVNYAPSFNGSLCDYNSEYCENNGDVNNVVRKHLVACNGLFCSFGINTSEIKNIITKGLKNGRVLSRRINEIKRNLTKMLKNGKTPNEACKIGLTGKNEKGEEYRVVKDWCVKKGVMFEEKVGKEKDGDDENDLPTIDFWYTVIPNWYTVNDGLWGGVFKEKRYSKDSKIDFLFPTKEGGKYKELIVKVIGGIAEDYDEMDPNAERNKKAMIKNYRTTRWYEIKYDGKTGWVPVSATVLKNDIFKITINGKYIYDYYHTIHNRGYKNTSESNINKLLLHNTAGSTASSLIKGINSPPHYYLGREHRFDKNAEMDNKFIGYVPEYLNSGTVNSTGSDIEKKSISIEMVNWSWLNPSKETEIKDDREVINGEFNKFNFEKLKGDYDKDDYAKINHFVFLNNDKYSLIDYYFNNGNGFFEIIKFNNNNLSQQGITLKESILSNKKVFDKFYELKENEDVPGKYYYMLYEKYQEIIISNSYTNSELSSLYKVLNKIPFNYNFYNYLKNPYSEINSIIDVTGTYPFEVYTLNNASKAQRLTDGKIADYYERYTPEQYKNLNTYINHINYKYGFPSTTFNYDLPDNIPKKYGFYMYDTSISWENMKKKTLDSKDGIFSHRSIQQGGKMCPAPGFQIDRIPNLNN